eukprot:scaffold75580_cov14-Tisochrysis_lutea.AAC.1
MQRKHMLVLPDMLTPRALLPPLADICNCTQGAFMLKSAQTEQLKESLKAFEDARTQGSHHCVPDVRRLLAPYPQLAPSCINRHNGRSATPSTPQNQS